MRVSYRRRPVPRAWRDEHHELSVYSRFHSAVRQQGKVTYRAGGECACGERFGLRADRHNMDRADVIDAWKDHVEAVFYAEDTPSQKDSNSSQEIRKV